MGEGDGLDRDYGKGESILYILNTIHHPSQTLVQTISQPRPHPHPSPSKVEWSHLGCIEVPEGTRQCGQIYKLMSVLAS